MIANGAIGHLGDHVQKPVAQVPRLAQDPRMDHIMMALTAWDLHLIQLHVIQIVAQQVSKKAENEAPIRVFSYCNHWGLQ